MKKKSLAILSLVAAVGISTANPFITEVFFNAPGTDDGQEFFEIQGTPGQNLNGYYLLVVEGDSSATAGGAGVVDKVISLSGLSLGSNGLLLWRDNATVLSPAPEAGTTVNVADFNPDIENGSNTFILGTGTPPIATTDLDVNEDGTLDTGVLAGFNVVDAIGVPENDGTPENDFVYGTQVGFYDLPFPDTNIWGTGDYWAIYRVLNGLGDAGYGWVGALITGASPGPYALDSILNYFGDTPGVTLSDVPELSPGVKNFIYAGGSFLNGTVTLQNSDSDWSNETIAITIVNPNTGTPVQTPTVTLSPTGAYSFPLDITPGVYDIYYKGDTFLQKLVGSVNIDLTGNVTVNVSLINGDVDGDNEIAPNDFSLLAAAFGNVEGDPGYTAEADLDDDGEVGPSDFSILAGSFGESGDSF